jgi:ABC-type transport system substrate-binding protein
MSDDSIFKDDLNLRQALAYSIDKEGVNIGAFNGNGVAVKDFANASYGDYNTAWDEEDYYDYDADKAAELLAASNYDGQSIRIMYITSTAMDAVAQMVLAYFNQIGVQAELVPYDSMMFQSAQYDSTSYDVLLKNNGSTDYIVNQWKLCWDSRDFSETTGGTANFVQDETLDELMQACLKTDTYSEESLDAFHDYLTEQCYGYGIVEGPINIVHSGYITDVALDIRNQILPGACEYAE